MTQPLGVRLRRLRERANLTVGKLATAAKCSRQAIRNIECGEVKDPKLSILTRLAEALGCTLDGLAGRGEDVPDPYADW